MKIDIITAFPFMFIGPLSDHLICKAKKKILA